MTLANKHVVSLVFVIILLNGITNCQPGFGDEFDVEGYEYDWSGLPLYCGPDITFEMAIQYWRLPYTQEEIQPLINMAKNIFDLRFQNLTVDQAVEILPQTFSDAFKFLWFKFPEQFNITHLGLMEGLLQSQNGTQILFRTIEQPSFFAETIVELVTYVNFSCYSDPGLAVGAYLLQQLEPLLSEKYRDQLVEFLIGLAVDLIKKYNVQDEAIAILDPMISALQQSGDMAGVLSGLLDLASSDVVAVAFEQAMQAANVETNASDWGKTISMLFDEVTTLIDIQDKEFTNFVIKSLEDVVEQLK